MASRRSEKKPPVVPRAALAAVLDAVAEREARSDLGQVMPLSETQLVEATVGLAQSGGAAHRIATELLPRGHEWINFSWDTGADRGTGPVRLGTPEIDPGPLVEGGATLPRDISAWLQQHLRKIHAHTVSAAELDRLADMARRVAAVPYVLHHVYSERPDRRRKVAQWRPRFDPVGIHYVYAAESAAALLALGLLMLSDRSRGFADRLRGCVTCGHVFLVPTHVEGQRGARPPKYCSDECRTTRQHARNMDHQRRRRAAKKAKKARHAALRGEKVKR